MGENVGGTAGFNSKGQGTQNSFFQNVCQNDSGALKAGSHLCYVENVWK